MIVGKKRNSTRIGKGHVNEPLSKQRKLKNTNNVHEKKNTPTSAKNSVKKHSNKTKSDLNAPNRHLQSLAVSTDEKVDWKKVRLEKKELKLKRRQSKINQGRSVSVEAIKIYEQLKCRNEKNKAQLVDKLYKIIKSGNSFEKVVLAHDTARIIQCMVKYASPSVRGSLCDILIPIVATISTSKYGRYCVLAMLKYGSSITKTALVNALMGHIVRLCCHSISSKILDYVYLSVANPKQKSHMRQEFYGEIYKKIKDDNVKALSDTYTQTPSMKTSILSAVKANLERVANKKLFDNSLIHSILLEYLQQCEDDNIEEAVTAYASSIPYMLTTKDGCQAAILCFYKSTAKNRRAILKAIKEYLVKICTHQHGHIFVIAVVNSLDDTKATKKSIYDIIHPHIKELVGNKYGRRVIEWLVSPGNSSCFHPSFITTIEEGLKYSKKDKDTRRKEIFAQIEEPIALDIAANAEFWLSNKYIAWLTAEVIRNLSTTHFVKVSEALVKIILKPGWSVNVTDESGSDNKTKTIFDVEKIVKENVKAKVEQRMKKSISNEETNTSAKDSGLNALDAAAQDQSNSLVLGIEEAGLHIVIKRIIKMDKERLTPQMVENTETFGTLLVKYLTEDTLKLWLRINRACFILLNILEANGDETKNQLRNLILPIQDLLNEDISGAKLLKKKLF